MKLQVADIFEEALKLTGNKPEAAAQLTLAEAMLRLPAQTFDVRSEVTIHKSSAPLPVNLGHDPQYQNPVEVAVLEQ